MGPDGKEVTVPQARVSVCMCMCVYRVRVRGRWRRRGRGREIGSEREVGKCVLPNREREGE